MEEVKTFKYTRDSQPGNDANQIAPVTKRIFDIYWKYENPNEKNDDVIKDLLRTFGNDVANKLDSNFINNNSLVNPYTITDEIYNIQLDLYNKKNEKIKEKPKKPVYVINNKYFTYDDKNIDEHENIIDIIIKQPNNNNDEDNDYYKNINPVIIEETNDTIYQEVKHIDVNNEKGLRFFNRINAILKDKTTTKYDPYFISKEEWDNAAAAEKKINQAPPEKKINQAPPEKKINQAPPEKKINQAPPEKKINQAPPKKWWQIWGGRKSNKKRNGSKKNKNKKKKKSTQRK
jgi:hypothetical protein